jgi:hypothetical protein
MRRLGIVLTAAVLGDHDHRPGRRDCGSDQVFSQSSGTCVDIRQGSNPCPPGEVPMADRPVCVPKE